MSQPGTLLHVFSYALSFEFPFLPRCFYKHKDRSLPLSLDEHLIPPPKDGTDHVATLVKANRATSVNECPRRCPGQGDCNYSSSSRVETEEKNLLIKRFESIVAIMDIIYKPKTGFLQLAKAKEGRNRIHKDLSSRAWANELKWSKSSLNRFMAMYFCHVGFNFFPSFLPSLVLFLLALYSILVFLILCHRTNADST